MKLQSSTARHFGCGARGWSGPETAHTWQCPDCQGPLDFAASEGGSLDPDLLDGVGTWRYAVWLGMSSGPSLGEITTPLVERSWEHGNVSVKNESLNPTGSFKDRGAGILVKWLLGQAVDRVVLDSSGNAGAAMAAYAARAGISCRVVVPGHASPAKVAQAVAYGAEVTRVDGDRSDATQAALAAAATEGIAYASHKWHPAFVAGTQVVAFELWEQFGYAGPDVIAVPVGAGCLLLGLHQGFTALCSAGLVDGVPRLVAVQARGCAPIAAAFGDGPDAGTAATSLAEGIQIARAPREREVIAAIRASGGTATTVSDDEIVAAATFLAQTGLLVEPTGAVGLAGLARAYRAGIIAPHERVVTIATGSGLKTL